VVEVYRRFRGVLQGPVLGVVNFSVPHEQRGNVSWAVEGLRKPTAQAVRKILPRSKGWSRHAGQPVPAKRTKDHFTALGRPRFGSLGEGTFLFANTLRLSRILAYLFPVGTWGKVGESVKLTARLRIMPRLGLCGVLSPCPLCARMA
jgi:hypothetical protein